MCQSVVTLDTETSFSQPLCLLPPLNHGMEQPGTHFILQFSYKSREDKLSDASLRNAHSNWWVKILNVLLSKKPNRWAQNQPPTVVGRMRIPWQPV